MITAVISLINGLLTILSGILPGDPFVDWITTSEGLALGLGYLNWFFPIADCAIFLGTWCAVMVAWRVVQMILMTVFNFSDVIK